MLKQGEFYWTTLDQSINALECRVSQHNEEVEELKYLKKCWHPSTKEIYQMITSNELYDVRIEEKDYQVILGGDGRSAAWDKIEHGITTTLIIKPFIFLTESDVKIIKEYYWRAIDEKAKIFIEFAK